ncbi:acyl-CoA thioesterase [Cyanobium sp. NIES-981]|uniref:acyl-CoA thioesterase n=1 Tax=Cyanobium sp. NIES-981 TaxID=1851505 RepID=UPI0007DD0DBD|nr:acyl-CoA thioesterase [Cyanobium sp. NIES-981]SBO43477.1 conserved protein of unknown function [Cyanobium sp. NIES-981]
MHTVMEEPRSWRMERRVLPQHTDHAGVMWHGAYVAWMEEARVQALEAAGLAYSELSGRGLELPVVGLAISYRQALFHGDLVQVRSVVLPRQGIKLPWYCCFVAPDGAVAAEAQVELVLLDSSAGPDRRRVLRRLPPDLAAAVEALRRGPS